MAPRTWLRALAAFTLAVGLSPVLAVGSASAAPVGVDYTCRSTVFGIDVVEGPQTLQVDLDLPVSLGDEDDPEPVALSIDDPFVNFPFAVPDVQMTTQISLTVHEQGGGLLSTPSGVGNGSGSVDVGPNEPLPLGWPSELLIHAPGLSSGDAIEVRPGPIVLTYASSDPDVDGTLVSCTPEDPDVVIAQAGIHATSNQCVADPECNVVQDLEVGVGSNPQGLTLQELDNFTSFGSVQTAPNDQTLAAALDTVQVQDARGSDFGWTLTAFASTPFQGQTYAAMTIPAEALSLESACDPVTTTMDGDPSGMPPPQSVCTPGSAGQLPGVGSGSSVELASSNDSTSGTGGTWWVPLDGTLTIPAFQPADQYQMVLTVVLTSN